MKRLLLGVAIVVAMGTAFFYVAGRTLPADTLHRYRGITLPTPGKSSWHAVPAAWLIAEDHAVLGASGSFCTSGACVDVPSLRADGTHTMSYRSGESAVVVVGTARVSRITGELRPLRARPDQHVLFRVLDLVPVSDGPLTAIALPTIGSTYPHLLAVSVQFRGGGDATYQWRVIVR